MAGPASWASDKRDCIEYQQNEYRCEILKRIYHVLPGLATDPSLFPDAAEARRMFEYIGMDHVVQAIDAAEKEQRKNQAITALRGKPDENKG
jgi:hypothetical protein